jgi:hypothetical protein
MARIAQLLACALPLAWATDVSAADRIPPGALVDDFMFVCPDFIGDTKSASHARKLVEILGKGWEIAPVPSKSTDAAYYVEFQSKQTRTFGKFVQYMFDSSTIQECEVRNLARFEVRDAKLLTQQFPTAKGEPQSAGDLTYIGTWVLPDEPEPTFVRLSAGEKAASIVMLRVSKRAAPDAQQ